MVNIPNFLRQVEIRTDFSAGNPTSKLSKIPTYVAIAILFRLLGGPGVPNGAEIRRVVFTANRDP